MPQHRTVPPSPPESPRWSYPYTPPTHHLSEKSFRSPASPSDAIWEAGWTYTYSLCLGKSKLIYHWNDSGIPTHTKTHTGEAEIFETVEFDKSGTYDITLHEPYWQPESIDDYYTFLGWSTSKTATAAEYIQKGRTESTGLPYQISLYSETIDLYAVWQKVEHSGVWVDYENYLFNTQQGSGAKFDHIDDWQFNEYMRFTASMGTGYFEKINFPIRGCVPGKWYQLTFSEALDYSEDSTDPEKDPNKLWNDASSYSTTIAAEPNMKSGKESGKLTYYPMIPQMYDYNPHHYVWAKHQSEVNGETYVPMSEQKITFYATAETMYWIWDLSKLYDKNFFKIRFGHSSCVMLPDPVASTAYVDFPNTSHYGFLVKLDLEKIPSKDRTLQQELAYSTYKVSADYNNLVMYTFGLSSIHEKINVPLKNMVSGKKYRLTFTHKRDGYQLTSATDAIGLDYCYAVKPTELTSTSSSNLHSKDGYTNDIFDSEFTQSVEFTASAETMYWVWSVSRLCDGDYSKADKSWFNVLTFSNVSITQIN